MSDEVDVAIVGAGVAGLCLARALLARGYEGTVLLLDGARDDDELRTLSFWCEAPCALDDLVRHRWRRLVVADADGGARTLPLASHTYQTVFFADLQRAVKDALRADPRHRVIDGRLTALDEDAEGVTLSVGDRTLRARWVFDSRFRRAELSVASTPHHLLWQRFHGLAVRAPREVFDPSAAVFLDFRGGLPAGTAFAYLLPYSPREALVELVTLAPLDAETTLRRYLASVHGVTDVEVLDREAGASPMTDLPFEALAGPRLRRIGIPAGMLKPSTGYAVTRILADSEVLADALCRGVSPGVRPPARALYRFLDGVFLTLWARWPSRMPGIFAALFARVPADVVLRFLDERASWRELLTLVSRLPLGPFVGALWVWLGRRLPFGRRT
ncbi:MAG: lycopene cyclase family protein [Polyangiales bacterium]